MAYKFQLGTARLSGSVIQEGDVTAEAGILSGSEISGSAIALADATGIAGEGVRNASGKLELHVSGVVASKSSLAQLDSLVLADSAQSYATKKITFSELEDSIFGNVSGDATIAAGGALTIAAGAVSTSMLADAAANTVLVRDANSTGAPSFKAVADTQLLIGDGTGFTAAALSGDVTMTNAGVVTIAANAVEGSMLNSNVPASAGGIELSSSALQIKLSGSGAELRVDSGGLAVSDQLAAFAGLNNSDGNIIVGNGSTFVVESGNTARTSLGLGTGDSPQFTGLTLTGDLIVQGTTTTIDSTTLTVVDANILIASGAANAAAAAGAGLTVDGADIEWKYAQNGTGDAASSGDIWLASGSTGYIDIQASNFYGALVGNASTATALATARQIGGVSFDGNSDIDPTDLNLADAASANSNHNILIAAGATGAQTILTDGQLTFNPSTNLLAAGGFSGDGSNLTGITADVANGVTIRTSYAVTSSAAQSLGGLAGVYSTAVNSASSNMNLHLSGAWSDGDQVYIKAPGQLNGFNVTISRSGSSDLIDGETSVVLESDNAAISLIYSSAGNAWMIF